MSEYVVIYESGEGSWGAFLPHLPGVIALGGSRDETEERAREAVVGALEWDREHPGALPETSPAVPPHVDAALERCADGTWRATLSADPSVRARGATRDQVVSLIAEAAAEHERLKDDAVDVGGSIFEAAMLEVPAVVTSGSGRRS